MGIKNADTKICSAVTRHADKLGRCKDEELFWNIQEKYLFFYFFVVPLYRLIGGIGRRACFGNKYLSRCTGSNPVFDYSFKQHISKAPTRSLVCFIISCSFA